MLIHSLKPACVLQTQYAEQQLSICADRDNKLRLLRVWVKGRKAWMRLARKPVSHSAAEKHLKECEVRTDSQIYRSLLWSKCSAVLKIYSLYFVQELGEELKAESAKLNELRKSRLSEDEEHTEGGFISHINTISQALTAVTEQVELYSTLPHEYNNY